MGRNAYFRLYKLISELKVYVFRVFCLTFEKLYKEVLSDYR